MSRWIGAGALAACAALLAVPAARATIAEHPDFTEDRQRPARLVLLPPESSIVRGKIAEAEPMIKETEALEAALGESSARELGALGYQLDTQSLAPAALLADRELQGLTEQARARALEVLVKALHDPGDVGRGRFTIGDVALPLAARTGATGMLLLHSESLIVSKGNKALAAVFNPFNLAGATRTRTQVLGAIYDLRDGQLLAIVAGADLGAVLKRPETVAHEAMESAFRGFPRRGTGRAAKKKFRAQAPARDLAAFPDGGAGLVIGGRSEGEVLAAFEAAARQAETETETLSEASPAPERPTGSSSQTGSSTGTGGAPGPASERAPAGASPRGGSVLSPPAAQPAELLLRIAATPPEQRPPAELRLIFFGDTQGPSLSVRNLTDSPLRLSIDLGELSRLEPGASIVRELPPGSHRLLLLHAEEDRELARGACVVAPGRSAVAEIERR